MSQSNYKKIALGDLPAANYVGFFYSTTLGAPALIDEAGVVTPFAVGTLSYTYVQSVASSSWIVNHNLGFKPAVEVLSAGGMEVEAEVMHTSNNQTIINFVSPQTGSARLN